MKRQYITPQVVHISQYEQTALICTSTKFVMDLDNQYLAPNNSDVEVFTGEGGNEVPE